MADENTATSTDAEAQDVQEAQDTKADAKPEMSLEDYKAALGKAREEAAKYRTQRNEFRVDAEKFREQQEAEKSELQRVQEALEAEKKAAAEYKVELARVQALAKYGIAEDNADLLGSDPEKFEANAQRLGELQAQAAKRAAPPSDYPVEDLKPGASDNPAAEDVSFPSSWPVTGPFATRS